MTTLVSVYTWKSTWTRSLAGCGPQGCRVRQDERSTLTKFLSTQKKQNKKDIILFHSKLAMRSASQGIEPAGLAGWFQSKVLCDHKCQ